MKRKLNKDKRRCEELDTIIKKLYESYAVGRIGEERFDTLLAGYEQEQTALRQSVTEAEAALDSFEQDTANVERFLALAKKYTDFSELITPMINEFIEKIIVHAPEKIDGRQDATSRHLSEIHWAVRPPRPGTDAGGRKAAGFPAPASGQEPGALSEDQGRRTRGRTAVQAGLQMLWRRI